MKWGPKEATARWGAERAQRDAGHHGGWGTQSTPSLATIAAFRFALGTYSRWGREGTDPEFPVGAKPILGGR